MRLNKTGVAVGLAVGVLAGGAGGVLAATGGTTSAPFAGMSPGHCHGPGGMYGMRQSGERPVHAAAASYLGISQTRLQTERQSGKTLAEIAKAQGKSVSGLQDTITAAAKAHLDDNSALTADQKAAITAQMKARLSTMINEGHQPGAGMGMMGPQMRGMWR
jgi:hypothetical protein